jgi:hypothetical protein
VNAGFKLTNCDDSDSRLFRQILLTPVEEATSRAALAWCDHVTSVRKTLILSKNA